MTQTSDKILETIKCKHITPVSKWRFLLKNYVFWLFFLVSVFLGSLSFSVIVHIINSGDFEIVDHLQGSLFTSAVMLLPYFWLLFLGVFALVAFLNWKCTKHGYRYKRRWIFLGSIVLSMFFGSIFFLFGLVKNVDHLMGQAVPFYDKSKHDVRRQLWFHPEKGFLTGKIISVDEVNEKIVLVDEDGKHWIILDEGTKWESENLEKRGKIVKVIGERTEDDEFKAKEIRRCNNCEDDEEF